MSNLLPLLPLALDAGAPLEADRATVPKTLATRQAVSPRKVVGAFYVALIALVLGAAAWDAYTSPTEQVAAPQGGSCAAP